MRTITLIILHCSATKENRRYRFEDCKRDHLSRPHYKDIGYHFYIERDGKTREGRPVEMVGAHCLRHNLYSIGVCYEGGLDRYGKPTDTRTVAQKDALLRLLARLKTRFPHALIMGHRELTHDRDCPCFDVSEYRELFA